ncbi:MAG: hypothetical protein JWN30_1222 [Bacilli bacterium]|nr:hypothetical protein [Bacilli bacterium]
MTLTFVEQFLRTYGLVFTSPFFYAGLLVIGWQYVRQNQLERQLFGLKITNWKKQLWVTFVSGAAVGLCASLAVKELGIALTQSEIIWLWAGSLLLTLWRVRFVCLSYSAGLLSVLSLTVRLLPVGPLSPSVLHLLWTQLQLIDVRLLLELVAVLHLAEAVLVILQGHVDPSPVFVEGKRGRVVGGFLVQKYWLLPIALNFPLPTILAYSGVCLSSTPGAKAKRSSALIACYALILLAFCLLANRFQWCLWIAAIWSPLVHDWMIRWETRRESSASPRYTKQRQGLRILAVLPGSLAERMGLRSEEVIVRVNKRPVSTPFDLHFAINQHPAYVRLEVLGTSGEIRFEQKPLFEGTHHALGLVLVPDENSREYIQIESVPVWKSLLGSLWLRLRGRASSISHSA